MRWVIFVLVIFASWPAKAEKPGPDSANFWYQHCTGANESSKATCTWYITGYIRGREDGAGWQGLASKTKVATPLFCVPQNVTYIQIRLVVAKFMTQHPELLHHSFGSVIAFALGAAFPCTR